MTTEEHLDQTGQPNTSNDPYARSRELAGDGMSIV